jgi:hypothetical protein
MVRNLNVANVPLSCREYRMVAAKRACLANKFLYCCLANSRSLFTNQTVIQKHIIESDLDLIAITLTWLTPEHGEEILRSVCLDDFSAVNITKPGKRDGGLAIIHRDTIRVSSLPMEAHTVTFEQLALSLQFNSNGFNLVVFYRPPASKTDVFLSEYSNLL